MQTAVGEVRTNSWFQLVRTKTEFGSDFQNWTRNWVLGYYDYIICVKLELEPKYMSFKTKIDFLEPGFSTCSELKLEPKIVFFLCFGRTGLGTRFEVALTCKTETGTKTVLI